jgi:hypothetical protein
VTNDNSASVTGASSINELRLGCDSFDSVVMKRAEPVYPVQLRSVTEEKEQLVP